MSKIDVYNSKTGETNTINRTPEEEEKRTADSSVLIAEETVLENAKTKKDADAKTGNDKLIALGLSQDEVTAMTGYTIPVEE